MKKSLKPVKKVMLIFPPMLDVKHVDTMVVPPLGIAYLAAYIRDIVEVKLLDALVEDAYRSEPFSDDMAVFGLSNDEIIRRIREYAPDFVGISCVFTSQFRSVVELSKRIKNEIGPDTIVATGGTHPSFLPERSMKDSSVDYIVIGEGEIALKKIIEAHNEGGGIENIRGLAYRDENGNTVVNKGGEFIQDLDSLPFPARDLLPMEKYFEINVPMGLHWRKRRNTPMITSRGCPYRCTYCSSTVHWGSRYRFRSPEKVLDEIQELKTKFGVEELKFQDDNLSLPRWRVEKIFRGMIERGLAMPWNTPNGIALWTLDDDMMRLMKASGCFEITLAVESGDPYVLKNILNKPVDIEKAKYVARLARKYGISTNAYFIIGIPGETMENIAKTAKVAMEMKLDYATPFIYNPLPGSPLFQICLDKGYLPADFDPGNVSSYFQTGIKSEHFDSKTLSKLQRRIYFLNLAKMPFRNPRILNDYYWQVLRSRPNFLKTMLKFLSGAK